LRNESAAHLSSKYRLMADIADNARPLRRAKSSINTLCARPPPKEPYATIFVFHIEAAGALGPWRGVGDGIALTVRRGTSKSNHINLLRDIPHVSWPGSRDPAFA
jgi:hypothetical protein